MARLSHPNIVRIYGGCLTPPNLFVVAELMAHDLSDDIHLKDSLQLANDSLRGGSYPDMDLKKAVLIALDIINGLVRRILACPN